MLFPKYSINYYSNGDSGKKNLTLTDKLCSLLSFSITTNSHFKKFHEKILIVPPSINTSIKKHVYFSVHLYFMAKRLREQWEKFSEWKLLVVVLPSNTFISYWILSHWKLVLSQILRLRHDPILKETIAEKERQLRRKKNCSFKKQCIF